MNMGTKLDEMKSDMINAQKSVIRLQGELLDIKTIELDSVQRAVSVRTAVEDTVQAEIKSYSAAESKHSPSSASTFTAENLK